MLKYIAQEEVLTFDKTLVSYSMKFTSRHMKENTRKKGNNGSGSLCVILKDPSHVGDS